MFHLQLPSSLLSHIVFTGHLFSTAPLRCQSRDCVTCHVSRLRCLRWCGRDAVLCCCVLLRLGTAVTMGRMLWDATVRIIWRPTAKCSVQHIAALPPPPLARHHQPPSTRYLTELSTGFREFTMPEEGPYSGHSLRVESKSPLNHKSLLTICIVSWLNLNLWSPVGSSNIYTNINTSHCSSSEDTRPWSTWSGQ